MTYRSNSSKWPTPDQLHHWHGVKFWLSHIHDGNDPDKSRRAQFIPYEGADVPLYVTYCAITDESGEVVLAEDWSICNPKDVPNRKLGHEIAVSRCIAAYMNEWGSKHPVNAYQHVPPRPKKKEEETVSVTVDLEVQNESVPDKVQGAM